MERGDAAAAQPDDLDARDPSRIEQRQDIDRGLPERISRCVFTGRSALSSQIRRDQLESRRGSRKYELPISAVPHEAVQPEQRLAGAVRVPVQLDAASVDHHGGIILTAAGTNQSGAAAWYDGRTRPSERRV